MSYQSIPAAGVPPTSGAPGRALAWIGGIVIVAGLGAGAALYLTAQQRFDSRVTSLAEESAALSGCITDLTFTKRGTFVLYYLSEGTVRVNGTNDGCSDEETVELDADDDVPDMELILTDDDGDSLRLNSPSLDEDTALTAGGVKAWPFRQVSIRTTGDYQIEISAEDEVPRFAIGLGPEIEEPTLLLPALVAAAGLVLGILLIVIGGARRTAARRQPTGTAVGYGYPAPGGYQAPGGFQAPGQYPAQPPVVYQPPQPQGFDHPTQSMPPIMTAPEPVGPFGQAPTGPPAGPAAAPAHEESVWSRPEPSGWTAPSQPPVARPPEEQGQDDETTR